MLRYSMLIDYPDIASDWDNDLNEKGPESYSLHSNKYAHWICPVGHKYVSKINNRVKAKGNGCKYCNGQDVLRNFNDLLFLYPEIAKEWHPTKNGMLLPDMVTSKSNRRVWWLCEKCGMEWETKVYHRVDGSGCPYCSGLYPIPGKTDLKTLYPGIEKIWDYSRNKGELPEQYSSKSHHKAFWICSNGHSYQSPVFQVTNAWDKLERKGLSSRLLLSGCPVCNYSRRIVSGENDLDSQSPWLMKEWDFERNTVKPNEIAVHSNLLVDWVCENKHRWKASPNNRSRTGCPVCNASKLYPGENSLDVIDPRLSEQWSSKNAPVSPRDVTAFCNDKYLWVCPEGHEWTATVANRHLGEGCPYCTHRSPIKGETDLGTRYPEIAKQLLPELNNGRKAEDFMPYSNFPIIWKCSQGHQWKTPIYCRTLLESKCPVCSGKKAVAGETDLLTIFPDIGEEFLPELNNGKRPEDFLPNSREKINWKCKNGHIWSTTIYSRTHNGTGCPLCKNFKHLPRKYI